MTRLQIGLMAVLLVAILIPAAYTQRGGFGGGKGGPGGKGGFNSDMIFGFIAKGAETFDVNKVEMQQMGPETVEQQREKMNTYLQTKGVTNGVMTKELYKGYFEGRMRDMTKENANKEFDSFANGGNSFNVDTVEITNRMARGRSPDSVKEGMKKFLASKGVNNGVMTKELYAEYSDNRRREFMEKGDTRTEEEKKKDMEFRLRDSFKQMDTNSDGFITMEEALAAKGKRIFGDSISDKENFERFDANKDSKISYEEFQKYIEVRTEERGKKREEKDEKKDENGLPKVDDLDARPTVFRFGKMPKDLPTWFNDADTDKDAQIGLYEWKTQGKEVREFLAMDANGDGFLTAEEMIRFQKAQTKGVDLKTAMAGSGRPQGGAIDVIGKAPPVAGGGGGGGFDFGKGKGKGKGKGGEGFDMEKWKKMREEGGGKGGKGGKGGEGFDMEKWKKMREEGGGKGGKGGGKGKRGGQPEGGE